MGHFKNTLIELGKRGEVLDAIMDEALKLGAKEKGLNVCNAILTIRKNVDAYLDLKKEAEELGTTLANAVKAYRMRNKVEFEIPALFRVAPAHWVKDGGMETRTYAYGWKERHYKTAEVTALTAQRRLEKLWPLIATVLEAFGDDTHYVASMEKVYKEDSYADFSESLLEQYRNAIVGDTVDYEPEENEREEIAVGEVDLDLEAQQVLNGLGL